MILCSGEALIDMIPYPTEAGTDGFVPFAGGAVFNTAIALGRLGTRVGLLTGLSTDIFGQQLRTALVESHVDTSQIISSDRLSTLAFVRLTDGHATYTFYDENSAGRMLRPEDMPELSAEISALYFGGISLTFEPGADAYAALLDRECGMRAVMMDPNIRPGFIADIPRYRARLDRMLSKTDIVKVSDEDLDWLVPDPVPLRRKVDAVMEKGPAVVILTRGSAGATAVLPGGVEVSVPAQRVEIVDTVGAGDSFNAGVLARLAELGHLTKDAVRGLSEESARSALEYGARVAAVTVSRAGANPPWANEI